MGNKYKEILCTIDRTWSWNQYKGSTSLPRNLNKKKIHHYNYTDSNVLKPQHNKFYTLQKSKNNKSLNKSHEYQDTDGAQTNSLVLLDGTLGATLSLPEDSKNNGKHLATWNGKSLKKDEARKLKGYVSDNNIKTLCIVLTSLIDCNNGLKPLFKDVVSQSSTIDKLCINIGSTAEREVTTEYFKDLLLYAVKSLHKSEGQFLKNIYIGSNINNKHINAATFEKILKAISEVNKNTKLESKTHHLKLIITVNNDYIKLFNDYVKKSPKNILFKIGNCIPSSTNDACTSKVEIFERDYPSILKKFYTTIRNISSNKSAYDEEDTNMIISTTDNQDSLQDNVALGDSQLTADYMYS